MIEYTFQILQKLRGEAGLTQEEVAERIGVERATYARYESGARKLSASALMELAHFYEVSPEYIMLMEEPNVDEEWEHELIHSARRLNVEGRKQLIKQLNYLLTDKDYTKERSKSAI